MRRALLSDADAPGRVRPLAACATEATDPPAGLDVEGDGFDPSEDLDEEIDEPIAPDTGLDGDEAPTSDQVVRAALSDVDAFWARTYEDLYGSAYEPISGGFWPYGPAPSNRRAANRPPPTTRSPSNAFYCPGDDLIAWDNVHLIPGLYEEFGGFTIGIVFAHEFGHAIQTRAGEQGPTVLLELQADCFAGAWTRDVEQGNSEFFELTLERPRQGGGRLPRAARRRRHRRGRSRRPRHRLRPDRLVRRRLRAGRRALRRLPRRRSPTATSSSSRCPSPARMTSSAGATSRCPSSCRRSWRTWRTSGPSSSRSRACEWTPVTDLVPIDPGAAEVQCGGETYSGDVLVNASFYCVDDDTIYIDDVNLVPALNEIGDYAVATEIARQYAYAAQVRLGIEESDLATNLHADCLAGRLRVEWLPRRPTGPGSSTVPLPR